MLVSPFRLFDRPDILDTLRESRAERTKRPTAAGTPTPVTIIVGVPKQLLMLNVSESPSKQLDRTFSLISLSFARDATDQFFNGAHIWVKGYKANKNWSLVTDGSDSPISFLMESTGETVTFAAQAFGPQFKVPTLDGAPTTQVKLNGVTTAPPAPSIASNLTTTPTGYQFSFNILGAQLADVIQSYKVYRNTTNSSGSATVVKVYPHPNTSNGVVTFQDAVPNGTTYFYWVSAVNNSGLESSLTQAQSVTTSNTTPIDGSGNLLLKNIQNANGSTSGPTTTSTSFVLLTDMTKTITTKGNQVLCLFSGTFTMNSNADNTQVQFFRDSGAIGPVVQCTPASANNPFPLNLTFLDSPSAGSHTYEVRWQTFAGHTATSSSTFRAMQVVELG